MWTQWGKKRLEQIEKAALKYIHDQGKIDSQGEVAISHRESSPGLCDDLEETDRGRWEEGSGGTGYMYSYG